MTRRGIVLFALMSVIWGIPYLFIKVAVAEISPATLVFSRTALAALILLPVALLRGDLRPVLQRWRWVAAFALIEVALPWVSLGSAEQRLSSSLTGLLVAGVPLVGTVIGAVTGSRDRVTLTGVTGLLVGVAGVAAIVGLDTGPADPPALAEMAVVVVGYALGPVILARRLGGLSAVAVMASSLALCAVAYAPVALLQRPPGVPSLPVLGSVAVLGVVCTAAAFPLFSALIAEVGPVRATVITYVNPAVAAILGVLVLGEAFTRGMAVGFALTVIGSALATRQSPRRTEAVAPAAQARRQGSAQSERGVGSKEA